MELQAGDESLQSAGMQVRAAQKCLRAEKRYGVSVNLLCIAELLLVLTTAMLVEQEAELDQLCQTIEQLQEEKAKESRRVDKLAKELNGEYFMVGVTGGVISFA